MKKRKKKICSKKITKNKKTSQHDLIVPLNPSFSMQEFEFEFEGREPVLFEYEGKYTEDNDEENRY